MATTNEERQVILLERILNKMVYDEANNSWNLTVTITHDEFSCLGDLLQEKRRRIVMHDKGVGGS